MTIRHILSGIEILRRTETLTSLAAQKKPWMEGLGNFERYYDSRVLRCHQEMIGISMNHLTIMKDCIFFAPWLLTESLEEASPGQSGCSGSIQELLIIP